MLHEALLIYVLREMHLLEYIYTQDERVNLIIEYVRVSPSIYKYKMVVILDGLILTQPLILLYLNLMFFFYFTFSFSL